METAVKAAGMNQWRPEDPCEPRLMALYRAATPEAKLQVVARLNGVLLGLKAAQLAADRPDLTPGQRKSDLRRWWLGARD
jgi:hypothetical protein